MAISNSPVLLAPVQDWKAWLAYLCALSPDEEDVAEEIRFAELWIPQREELEEQQQALDATHAKKVISNRPPRRSLSTWIGMLRQFQALDYLPDFIKADIASAIAEAEKEIENLKNDNDHEPR